MPVVPLLPGVHAHSRMDTLYACQRLLQLPEVLDHSYPMAPVMVQHSAHSESEPDNQFGTAFSLKPTAKSAQIPALLLAKPNELLLQGVDQLMNHNRHNSILYPNCECLFDCSSKYFLNHCWQMAHINGLGGCGVTHPVLHAASQDIAHAHNWHSFALQA